MRRDLLGSRVRGDGRDPLEELLVQVDIVLHLVLELGERLRIHVDGLFGSDLRAAQRPTAGQQHEAAQREGSSPVRAHPVSFAGGAMTHPAVPNIPTG
jgi:hypothetical protein